MKKFNILTHCNDSEIIALIQLNENLIPSFSIHNLSLCVIHTQNNMAGLDTSITDKYLEIKSRNPHTIFIAILDLDLFQFYQTEYEDDLVNGVKDLVEYSEDALARKTKTHIKVYCFCRTNIDKEYSAEDIESIKTINEDLLTFIQNFK